jgi:hypothetical protein
MRELAILMLAATTVFAADDPWAKVKELKSGSEVRILKKGSAKPVEGKLDEVRDTDLVVILKNEQVAIPKDQVDRLDARTPGSRKTSLETKTDNPNTKPPTGMSHGAPVPGTAYSTTTSIGGKPDYETLYRRGPAEPKKK